MTYLSWMISLKILLSRSNMVQRPSTQHLGFTSSNAYPRYMWVQKSNPTDLVRGNQCSYLARSLICTLPRLGVLLMTSPYLLHQTYPWTLPQLWIPCSYCWCWLITWILILIIIIISLIKLRGYGNDVWDFFILGPPRNSIASTFFIGRVEADCLPHCDFSTICTPILAIIIASTTAWFLPLVTSSIILVGDALVLDALVWATEYSSSKLLLSEESTYCLDAGVFLFESLGSMCTWKTMC